MTAFRPGDLAVVTGDTAGWDHGLEPGAVVELLYGLNTPGYACRHIAERTLRGIKYHDVAEADLRPHGRPTPTPSPLDALIESATALIQDVRAGRLRIEATWLNPTRTDYSVIVTPEEKS